MKELPSAEDFFGASQGAAQPAPSQNLPSADEFFTPTQPSTFRMAKSALSSIVTADNPIDNPAIDTFMQHTAPGRIMGAFGHAFAEGGEGGELGIKPGSDTENLLKKAGIFNDYAAGENNFGKAVNEAFIRPAAVALDTEFRGLQAGLGALGAGIQQTSEEAFGKSKGVLGEIPAITEYLLTTPAGMEVHAIPPVINEGRSLAVIGEDEGAYFGLKEPTPEQAIARQKATEAIPPEVAPTAVKDIHAIAREVAPETFDKYDELSAQKEDLRGQLQDLSSKRDEEFVNPHDEEMQILNDKMDTILNKVGGEEGNLTNKQTARLNDLRNQYNDLVGAAHAASQLDTEDMINLRSKIQQTDYAMRDIAPEVSAAYREAQNRMPPELREAQEPESEGLSPQPEATLEQQTPKAESIGTTPSVPLEKQLANISQDVSNKLLASGRPLEESQAASELIAQHYKAVADQGWAKGTPEEIYKRDAANIVAGKERVRKDAREFAQSKKPLKTNTLAFKKWFGDSKVKDATGGPLVVYHGTSKDITEFNTKGGAGKTSGTGAFFTDSPAKASTYATGREGANVVPAYLSLKNPIIIDARGQNWHHLDLQTNVELPARKISNVADNALLNELGINTAGNAATNIEQGRSTNFKELFGSELLNDEGLSTDDVVRWARKEGHESVIIKNVIDRGPAGKYATAESREPATLYVAFEPDQIKSVNNRGTFEPENPNILEQKARGKIRLATDDAKAAITLFKTADASTFIHETGHAWLDEMMRYAKAEDAPTGLLKDRDTINNWLGVKEGEEIKRAQHEKFARGFERYLMEGTAPSKELAGVFAKFKQWLTDIYQTVQKLKSPITEDIRNVFDRLLSANPERTVIAPDRESAEIIQNMHEKLAERTPPEQAAGVADNVRATIDRLAKQEPELYNELKAAESTAGTPSSTGEIASAPTGTPEAAQPIAKQPNEVSAGGDDLTPESITKPTNNPNARLGRAESNLVDKAGNIRLDNLNTPEDISQVIRDTASQNNNFMGARRNVISDGQVLDLADALGMDSTELSKRKLGEAFNAEQIVAARKLLIQSAENVRDLGAKAAEGAESDLMAYAEARARHITIQEQVSGITAEAGRALRAFRELEGGEQAKAVGQFLKENTGLDLFQLQEEAKKLADLDTTQKVSKLINDSKKATYKNMILEYYINSLISGPITHLRYSVGNALNALWTPLVEVPAAAAVGTIREFVTGKEVPDRVYLGESGAQLHGIIQGSKNGLQAAATAWRTAVSPALPGEEVSPMFATKTNAIPGTLGKVINIPSKGVAAIHSFFKSIRYEQNIQGLAYREALKDGLREGSAEFTNRVAELGTSPTEAMMSSAVADTLKELYMSPTEYNSAAGKLTAAINSNLAAKIIMPFMKIGSQITRNAFIERTPLGLLTEDVRNRAFYAEGIDKGDMQLAKMATGVALMGGVSALVLEGLATGDGPIEPNKRAIWLLNHRPNSIQVGGITVPYQGLGHLGMLMRFSANMTETAQGWGGKDGTKMAKAFMEGITRSVLDENFMRGLKDMLDAVYHPEEYGENYIRQFATNWLPFSVGMSQVAREVDPYHREARDMFDAARAKIPYVSQELQPKRDVFGEEVLNGINEKYASDPVVQRLESVQMGIGKLDRKIRGIQLTDQQYDDYSRLAGRMTKMRLTNYVNIPGSSSLPSGVQIKTMQSMIDNSRETARRIVMMNNPDIIKQSIDNKISALKKP